MRYLALISLFAVSPLAFADGGAVQFQRDAGPFIVTVFAPAPLRVGPVDFSVLIQSRGTLEPVLDARVSIQLDDGVAVHATRDQAQNKLLYATTMDLHTAGRHSFTAAVKSASYEGRVAGDLNVAPPSSVAAGYRGYFSIPPLCMIIFGLREWLLRRGPSRR
jgi:hypothetical protein